jgi:Arc/MetJ-type ribon-helix-helix transcriptional regulator
MSLIALFVAPQQKIRSPHLKSRYNPPHTIHLDGKWMINMADLKLRPADSEKITINLFPVDLGQIDLLVQQGFYANRSDLIRTAIRNQLNQHADVVRQAVERNQFVLGLQQFTVADLEAARAAGEMLNIRVLGLATIAPDVTPELAAATIQSIAVLGALHASPAVKAALAGRIT